MSENILVVLVASGSTLIAALGGYALTYFFGGRKEERDYSKSEKEKKEKIKQEKNRDLNNAFRELDDALSVTVRLSLLDAIKDYDYHRMFDQVKGIEIKEIQKYSNNIFLNKKERSVSNELHYVSVVKKNLELMLALYSNNIINLNKLKDSIKRSKKELEERVDKVGKYL